MSAKTRQKEKQTNLSLIGTLALVWAKVIDMIRKYRRKAPEIESLQKSLQLFVEGRLASVLGQEERLIDGKLRNHLTVDDFNAIMMVRRSYFIRNGFYTLTTTLNELLNHPGWGGITCVNKALEGENGCCRLWGFLLVSEASIKQLHDFGGAHSMKQLRVSLLRFGLHLDMTAAQVEQIKAEITLARAGGTNNPDLDQDTLLRSAESRARRAVLINGGRLGAQQTVRRFLDVNPNVFSIRLVNCLEAKFLHLKLLDFLMVSDLELLRVRQLGMTTLRELRKKLAVFGLAVNLTHEQVEMIKKEMNAPSPALIRSFKISSMRVLSLLLQESQTYSCSMDSE